ncbi:FKBP-type peptidyl-prolyl cis-trans isomerase [Spirosoma sp. SC4-14]|uniref:FKBP-type peptidyl-prolyl cis-trans isomerase n=1 Tax=Spirosoma sp. SC4-14 TaxID=3128900 RepID=UPI0030D4CE17
MRKFHLSILSALFMLGLASCMKESADPSSEYFKQNDQQIKAYTDTSKLSWQSTSSGLYYAITTANSTAKKATVGDQAEFSYKSYNLSGALVDSTTAGSPVYYPLGIQAILAGLEEGLLLMHEGERATFLLPSYLAYGSAAVNANLPAYSVVRFDVKLARSRTETEQIQQYIADKKLTVTDSSSTGLKIIKTVTNPTGATLTAGQTITIKYKGKMLRSATAFDSTGAGTFDATLGQSKYVAGFEAGLSKLRVGESATIIFPSALGYGTTGVVSGNTYIVTPYAPLLFELQVISAK